jgi:hypothetical protein
MPLYLTLSSGASAAQARPVLAVSDQRLIRELLVAVGRLGEDGGTEPDEAHPAVTPLRAGAGARKPDGARVAPAPAR